MTMETGKPGAQRAGNAQSQQAGQEEHDRDRPAEEAEEGKDALNDARALQQMIEGVPDSDEEFRRIEQKR